MNALITGAFNWTEERISLLKQIGCNLTFIEREDGELNFNPEEIDAVICNWLFVHHNIDKFTNLKFIQLLSAGMDRVPLDYINSKQIKLFNARGVYSVPMAEFAVCGVLQLYKDSRGFYEKQKNHIWQKNKRLFELYGKRVCVVGTGSVGSQVAKCFGAFTDEVYGVDLYPSENCLFKEIKGLDLLDNEISLSDILVITLPLTEQTRNMFDKRRLSMMKKGSVLVNISRGGLVDEQALTEVLKDNLMGAVVDVFAQEPLNEDSELWNCSNLILSPHNSFVSENNEQRMWEIIYNNLAQFNL